MVIYIKGSNETIQIQEKEDENYEIIEPNIFMVTDFLHEENYKEFDDINKAIAYGEELQEKRNG